MKKTLVKNVKIWQDMDGDTDLIKKLNSYLTSMYIGTKDIPSDECLKEAIYIVKLVEKEKK